MGDPWTFDLNRRFEDALAIYDQDTPDRWQNVARAVGGGMTAEEMRRHYERLERDVDHMQSTNGGRGSGKSRGESSRGSSSREQQRQGRL